MLRLLKSLFFIFFITATYAYQQPLKNTVGNLQCSVCIQALQLELAKPSDNAVDFSLLSVKSCKDATQVDQQQLLCVKTLLKNADQLFKDQKNGVSPTQSCMNLGLVCTPITQAPLPTTQAPLPTKPAPTPPLPPFVKPFVKPFENKIGKNKNIKI